MNITIKKSFKENLNQIIEDLKNDTLADPTKIPGC